MNMPLALIIGGSSGMGLASARRLLNRNIKVVIVGNASAKLDQARRELADLGPEEVFQSDLFLLGDDASRVTGAVWDVNGGVMAGRN